MPASLIRLKGLHGELVGNGDASRPRSHCSYWAIGRTFRVFDLRYWSGHRRLPRHAAHSHFGWRASFRRSPPQAVGDRLRAISLARQFAGRLIRCAQRRVFDLPLILWRQPWTEADPVLFDNRKSTGE
jgi:hypothetical protein